MNYNDRLSFKENIFTYFAMQLGEFNWAGKDVLDFGGNVGHILDDPNSTIEEERYWCLDIVKEAIDYGQKAYPKANFVFYNRHTHCFNPEGIKDLALPELNQKFDVIVAYSVFTHTRKSEFYDLVDQLKKLLKKDGKLLFTFIDHSFHSWPDSYDGNNLKLRLDKDNPNGDNEALVAQADLGDWCTLFNDNKLVVDHEMISMTPEEERRKYHVFYKADYMQSLFPESTILPPANNEMQHCCLMESS